MAKPKLNDVKLFLDELLRDRKASDPVEKRVRRELLQSLPSGALYVKLLTQKREAITALPVALLGLPLVELLRRTDALFDGFGKFIYYMAEAYKVHPTLAPQLLEAIEEIQDTFAPALSIFTENYTDEATRAKSLRDKLAEKKSLLVKFPVADGTTLFEAATAQVDNGEKLSALLSERSSASDADRSGAGQLLSNTLGIIRRCREHITDSLSIDPALPRDLERQIFGLLDDLAQRRTPTDDDKGAPLS